MNLNTWSDILTSRHSELVYNALDIIYALRTVSYKHAARLKQNLSSRKTYE